MKGTKWCLLTVALLLGGAGRLPAELITFDELPTQPVNGLSLKGVTFHFTVNGLPSADAVFNANGPGQLTYVQDPSLIGPVNGTLTLNFATPVTTLQFGVALSTFSPLSAGATVRLFNAGPTPLDPLAVPVAPTPPVSTFSEGQFRYSGAAVSGAAVTFNSFPPLLPGDDVASEQFAFDNLEFSGPSVHDSPEPVSLALFGLGGLAVFAAGRRRPGR